MASEAGAVVILNGASGAGKSSLCAALQRRLAARDVHVVVTGWDAFVPPSVPVEMIDFSAAHEIVPELFETMGYPAEAGPRADLGVRYVTGGPGEGRFEFGPVVEAAERAMHVAVSTAARAGMHVIVDELCRTPELFDHWTAMLDALDVAWVGIRCDDDTLRARNEQRGDRLPGLGVSTNAFIHDSVTYDLEIDSTRGGPDELAEGLDAWLADRWPGRLH